VGQEYSLTYGQEVIEFTAIVPVTSFGVSGRSYADLELVTVNVNNAILQACSSNSVADTLVRLSAVGSEDSNIMTNLKSVQLLDLTLVGKDSLMVPNKPSLKPRPGQAPKPVKDSSDSVETGELRNVTMSESSALPDSPGLLSGSGHVAEDIFSALPLPSIPGMSQLAVGLVAIGALVLIAAMLVTAVVLRRPGTVIVAFSSTDAVPAGHTDSCPKSVKSQQTPRNLKDGRNVSNGGYKSRCVGGVGDISESESGAVESGRNEVKKGNVKVSAEGGRDSNTDIQITATAAALPTPAIVSAANRSGRHSKKNNSIQATVMAMSQSALQYAARSSNPVDTTTTRAALHHSHSSPASNMDALTGVIPSAINLGRISDSLDTSARRLDVDPGTQVRRAVTSPDPSRDVSSLKPLTAVLSAGHPPAEVTVTSEDSNDDDISDLTWGLEDGEEEPPAVRAAVVPSRRRVPVHAVGV